jgi:hypothetical protein
MNFGIYGFPSTYGLATSSIISITEFDASGTYVIPANASILQILLIGGGGGGGGGQHNTASAPRGGGAPGSGGSIVYQEFLVSELGTGTRLNIQIGQGGNGGSRGNASNGGLGSVGSSSIITIPGRPGFYIRALGGAAGGGGATPVATPAAAGGAARRSYFNGVQIDNATPPSGSISVSIANSGYTGYFVYVQDQRSNGGAAGGNVVTTSTAQWGGSIEVQTETNSTGQTVNLPVIYDVFFSVLGPSGQGITLGYGGSTNGTPAQTKGQDGGMIFSSMKQFGGGFGGAGGGASVIVNGGNGGNGYRGSGGGGGGAAFGTGLSGGTGGNGGNGYCCIVARG